MKQKMCQSGEWQKVVSVEETTKVVKLYYRESPMTQPRSSVLKFEE
ncbi:hypothetical protein VN12_23120 [Pirellula sp. SH-Sr6A]|nr:hypothetical protein VN12_23120 [Pirellula sp. SH-Sr6A]